MGVPSSTVLISTFTVAFPLSFLAKNKSTAVKKAPLESSVARPSLEESGDSIFPPTTKDCARGSTNLWTVVLVWVFIVVTEVVVFVVRLVTVFVVRFFVVAVTVFSHCSSVPSELKFVSATEVSELPGRPGSFVELELNLNVLVPVEILTVGVGTVFGSLKKNVPIKSPKLSEISLKSFTVATARLVWPTNCIPLSKYPEYFPWASSDSETVSTFKTFDDWLYPEDIDSVLM